MRERERRGLRGGRGGEKGPRKLTTGLRRDIRKEKYRKIKRQRLSFNLKIKGWGQSENVRKENMVLRQPHEIFEEKSKKL